MDEQSQSWKFKKTNNVDRFEAKLIKKKKRSNKEYVRNVNKDKVET